jgi:hypothetical protein
MQISRKFDGHAGPGTSVHESDSNGSMNEGNKWLRRNMLESTAGCVFAGSTAGCPVSCDTVGAGTGSPLPLALAIKIALLVSVFRYW